MTNYPIVIRVLQDFVPTFVAANTPLSVTVLAIGVRTLDDNGEYADWNMRQEKVNKPNVLAYSDGTNIEIFYYPIFAKMLRADYETQLVPISIQTKTVGELPNPIIEVPITWQEFVEINGLELYHSPDDTQVLFSLVQNSNYLLGSQDKLIFDTLPYIELLDINERNTIVHEWYPDPINPIV